MNAYKLDLDKNDANYTPLSPLSFIRRAAYVYGSKTSVVNGSKRFTWRDTYLRSLRLACALGNSGISPGDTVSIMGYNTPEMYEAHFGVPLCGAVLHCMNTRLDPNSIAFMMDHADTKVLLTDTQSAPVIARALDIAQCKPLVIDIIDPHESNGLLLGSFTYEDFIMTGRDDYDFKLPDNEWDAISLNYTSGTTGDPKGVVYHHRGAYLNAMANIVGWGLPKHPVYLWTLPMFHCNGWCFPWTMAAVGGVNVCLRSIDIERIYHLIAEERVTHFCGAPIVHSMVAHASEELKALKKHRVKGMVAGAPPPASVLRLMEENGFDITHVYGLTETYGPSTICDWDLSWNELPIGERAVLKASQGVTNHALEDLLVIDPESLNPVPHDGQTLGEVMFRGNIVMKGYLKNPDGNSKAFKDGYFHSGDLAVVLPNGYIQLKDRSKDIIISGGENISSIEVEDALFKHPLVMDAAVVAKPDEKWGETPCAFVDLQDDSSLSASDLISFVRSEIAHYKCPKHIIFGPLPKTSTGKTQKYILRKRAKEL